MKVKRGQSVIDLSLQQAGSASAALEISLQSNISITDLVEGQDLQIPQIADKKVVDFFDQNNIAPATETSREIDSVSRVFFEELDIQFT